MRVIRKGKITKITNYIKKSVSKLVDKVSVYSPKLPDNLKSRSVHMLPSWMRSVVKKKNEQNVRKMKTSLSGPTHIDAASYCGAWKPQVN